MPQISNAAWWLMKEGRLAPDVPTLLTGLCSQLSAEGLQMLRANMQVQTLHPEVEWRIFIWRSQEVAVEMSQARIVEKERLRTGSGVVDVLSLGHGVETEAYLRSPIHHMVRSGLSQLHCPIAPGASGFEFPILKDLHAAGATGYFAMVLRYSQGDVTFCSFVTRKPGGFTADDLQLLLGVGDPLAMCLQVHSNRHVAETLLQTYVGRHAGARVLAGHVQRGDVERINAAIWFSDMRGFTQLSGTVDSGVFIGWLNDYFGAISRPITEHGGEILKFIGDAVMAVYPVGEGRDAKAACTAALKAARAAHKELDALNARRQDQGLPALNHGIALHIGEVQYGNIGAERRLDFTVIGPAVNMTSRLEGLCGKLGRRLVVSDDVNAHLGGELAELGAFELKGIEGSRRVWGEKSA